MSLLKHLFHKMFHKAENKLKENIDPVVVLEQYKKTTTKELYIANDKLDKITADLLILRDKKKAEDKAYTHILKALKKAQQAGEESDVNHLRTVAKQKLRLSEAYTKSIEHHTEAVEQLKQSIQLAQLEVEENITTLQLATIQDCSVSLDMSISLDSLKDIMDVLEHRKKLVEARKINDKELGRKAPKPSLIELDERLEDILNKDLENL